MSAEFAIVWKGQTTGPFNQMEIQRKLLAGEISPLHVVLKKGQPIDVVTWASQLKNSRREEEEEAFRRQEKAQVAENENLRFHQQENERLQRELKEAQQRASRPLPPPPPPTPTYLQGQAVAPPPLEHAKPTEPSKDSATGIIAAGVVCSLISLLFCPPAFGLAAFVCGIVALVKGNVSGGIGIIIMAVICTLAGMYFGAVLMSHL